MKRLLCAMLIAVTLLLALGGCNILANEKNTVGKSNNTVVTLYKSLVENFKLREKEGYHLYGVSSLVNSENVGTYTFIYTDKRPDELNYSDILIVEINNRTGRIEKFSSPEYAVYGQKPYSFIKTAMPLDPTAFKIDSDGAVKLAAQAHFGEKFLYNYIQTDVGYVGGQVVYDISHISLVYNCIYKTQINAMTGAIISSSVEEL